MKQAIITQESNKIAIQSPFDRAFLDDLKGAIPGDARKWDAGEKQWLVATEYADAALQVARQYFEVVDGRTKSASEIEDAQIDNELTEIRANQQYIQAREERINGLIADLDAQIGRYSPRSVSSVKGSLCRARALLAHSLDNARQDAESLTELQVRGMIAAVRYLEER